MPDSHNRRDTDYSKYEAMSTEELQRLLREDASKPEGEESNVEVLLYVMDVLAKRRQARNEGKSPEEALESFMQNYMPEDEESSNSESESTVRRFAPNVRRWMSGLIAAAAMFVLILGSSLTASALGFDLWDIIVKWTQETFHFGYVSQHIESGDPETIDVAPYLGLQDALDNLNIQIALSPTWFPDGYEEADIRVMESPKQREVIAKYQCGEQSIRIRIADFLDSSPEQIEQSDLLIEVYTTNGIDYYIFDNEGILQAVWINENFECYISGPLTISEIKNMIDSIEKG